MKHENTEIVELKGDLQVAMQYENLIAKLATSIYVDSACQTSTCAWNTYCDDLEREYGLEPGFIDEDVAQDIESKLYEVFGECIAQIEIIFEKEDGTDKEVTRYIEVTLNTNYCPGILEDDCSVEYSL